MIRLALKSESIAAVFIVLGMLVPRLHAGPYLLASNGDGLTASHGRINRYDASGAFIDVIVPAFSDDVIRGLTVEGGRFYISVTNTVANTNGRILRFDVASGALTTFIAPGSGGLVSPGQTIFGSDGKLYVLNNHPGSDEVLRFDGATGAFLGVFVAGLNIPHDLEFGPDGNLYVANAGADTISRFDGLTGSPLGTFVSAGSGGVSTHLRDLCSALTGNY